MTDSAITGLLSAAMLLVALVAVLEVCRAMRCGMAKLKSWPVAIRAERPIWFWLCITLQVILGGVCLWLSIRGAVSLLP